MILRNSHILAASLAQRERAHFWQRGSDCAGKKLHLWVAGPDAISDGVVQAIGDHDLIGWRSLLPAQGVEGFENSSAILGAGATDHDRKSGRRSFRTGHFQLASSS